MKRILLFVPVMMIIAACEQQNIYVPADYNITLDGANTYYAGDPVKFNITGNVDNLIFYSGETGHQYVYRDRFTVPEEDVVSAKLKLSIQHRFGNAGKKALDIYISNSFAGLSGSDGAADREAVSQMYEGGMEGWTELEFEDSGPKENVWIETEYDLGDYDCYGNFCLAFHWKPQSESNRKDTYWINGEVLLEIKGKDDKILSLKGLRDITVMMNESLDPYYRDNGDGSIRFDTQQDLCFAGGNIEYDCEGWAFTAPQSLNKVDNDTPVVVKNMQNYLDSYGYTYTEPGTYTATFVGTNENYLGSGEKVKEISVMVIDAPLAD